MKEILNRKLEEVKTKINNISVYFCKQIVSESDGQEHVVHHNIETQWREYEYLANHVIYKIDTCLMYIEKIEHCIDLIPVKTYPVYIAAYKDCDYLSYEFEELLVSFSRLNEESHITEICRYVSKTEGKRLRENCYQRDDVNGLYWQINLLRNRAAHSTPGYYTQKGTSAARYCPISSKFNIIKINSESEKMQFETSLINLEKSHSIKKLIKEVIIDKKFGEEESKKNIMDLVFSSTKPKGSGKSNPIMLHMSDWPNFDLYNDFFLLSIKMVDYILVQLDAFNKSY